MSTPGAEQNNSAMLSGATQSGWTGGHPQPNHPAHSNWSPQHTQALQNPVGGFHQPLPSGSGRRVGRLIGAILGGLVGAGLIVGGGISLSRSAPAIFTNDEIRNQLAERQLSSAVFPDLVLTVQSSSETVDSPAGAAAVAPILAQIRAMPKVTLVESDGKLMVSADKHTRMILVTVGGDGTDHASARATVAAAVNNMPVPSGMTVQVLGPATKPSWYGPVGWGALGGGVVLVFAAGAMAFGGSRRVQQAPIGNVNPTQTVSY
ncbi:MMPL family transporter [Nocardia sp. NPDC020380]|uniref:MMPL family transporter n=1 Tax=Nocardia sp. NPDC020380 TaxID=3364309 RepID=UPI0037AD96CC